MDAPYDALTAAMTGIEMAPEVPDGFDRFFEPIAQFDARSAPVRLGETLAAV